LIFEPQDLQAIIDPGLPKNTNISSIKPAFTEENCMASLRKPPKNVGVEGHNN